MILQTAAQVIAALALQPAASVPDYVILGDEARRARLERLLARRPASARPLGESPEGGMWFVGCITAWRENPEQTEDCLDSRLRRQGRAGTIVLNTYHPRTAQDALSVTCHGPGGTGRAVFGASPRRRDGAALEACLERGMAAAAAPMRGRVSVRWSDRFAIEDEQQARSAAARVLVVAIDHVGVPRGSTGNCLIQGRVVRQERGSGVSSGALVEAGIPCTAQPAQKGESRRVSMGAMREGSFGRLYLSEGHGVADFEAVDSQTAASGGLVRSESQRHIAGGNPNGRAMPFPWSGKAEPDRPDGRLLPRRRE